jgi:chromosome segregation ATPase
MTDPAELRRLAEHGNKTGHGVLLRDRELLDLLDERDELRTQLTMKQAVKVDAEYQRDAARADLAAANARLEMWWKELERANGVRDKYKAENAALRERIAELEAVNAELMEVNSRAAQRNLDDLFTQALIHSRSMNEKQTRIDKALAIDNPGPVILCDTPKQRDDQWKKALRAALAVDTPTTATAEGSVCSTCGDTEPTGGDICCYHACPQQPATAEGSDQ